MVQKVYTGTHTFTHMHMHNAHTNTTHARNPKMNLDLLKIKFSGLDAVR